MFQLGIIILAHKNFGNIHKLVQDLQHEGINIYIHVDAKNHSLYQKLKKLSYPNLTLVSKYKCKWAHISIVTVMLYCMRKCLNDGMDYISVISGEDIAIKPSDYIYNFFSHNKNNNFLDYRKSDGKKFWEYKNLNLYKYYFFIKNIIIYIPGFTKDKIDLFYCSQWLNINKEALLCILDYVDQNPDYIKYFSHSFSPDNFFFATIIKRVIGFHNTLNTNLRYVEWDNQNINTDIKILGFGGAISARTPKILSHKQIESIGHVGSRYIFARKYSTKL